MANNSSTYIRQRPVGTAGLNLEDSCEWKLWNDFRQGDKSAYAVIYTKFFPVLYGYGCRICKDKGLVQDCIQDLFMELSIVKNNLSETTSIRYYLYRCIRRKIAMKVGSLQAYKLEPFPDGEAESHSDGVILPIEFQQIEFEIAEEKRHEILKALELLTKKQRKVIQLRFFEDMSYQEISAVMSIHVNTVYNLISLATASLRKFVKRSAFCALVLLEPVLEAWFAAVDTFL